MHKTVREKHSLVLAALLGVTLTLSLFSNAHASSVSNLPFLSRDTKLTSSAAALDGDDDDQGSDNNHGKGKGNKDGNNEENQSDNGKGNKDGHAKKLKIKAKHDGGSVGIEDEEDGNNNEKQTQSGNDIESFPANFILAAEGGIAIEKGNRDTASKRFDDVSMNLSAAASKLEGSHIKVNVDGKIFIANNEFKITNGNGIIIFFKNPGKDFFRGIIHIAGKAVNLDDHSETKFHMRALLLPSGQDEQEGVWSFVVAPAAMLGPKIRIFHLIGELKEIEGTTPTPNPTLDHLAVDAISLSVTAGKLFNVTATAVSSDGKTLKTYDGKARISDLSGTVMPETTPRFHNGVFNGPLNITKSMISDKLTFTDIATNKKGTSNAFNVTSGSPVKVDLTPSGVTIKPGETAKFTAKGLDKFGNEIPSLTFSWSPSSSAFGSVSAAGKKANFTALSEITSEVSVDITATIQGGTLKDTSKITIVPKVQSLNKFMFDSIPGTKTAGALFRITVTAVNGTEDPISSYSGPMRLADTTGTFNMTVNSGFSNGVWTGNVNITKAAFNVMITAQDISNPAKTGTSEAFDVKAGNIDHFDFKIGEGQKTAGTEFGVIVTAKDAYDNRIIEYYGTLSLSSNDSLSPAGNASKLLPSPYTYNSDDQGQHTFQVTLYNAKSGVTISASDGTKTNSSTPFDVVPSTTIAKVIIIPHGVSLHTGDTLPFKAEAFDAYGNKVSGASFSWSVSTDPIPIGTIPVTSGPEVEFTAAIGILAILTGSITVTSGSASDSASITVTL